MSVVVTLLFIAAGVILVGIILAVVGTLKSDVRGVDGTPPTFLSVVLDLITKAWEKFNNGRDKWEKLSGLGMLLVLLGFGFLASAGVTAIVEALVSGGGTPGDATPSPTVPAS